MLKRSKEVKRKKEKKPRDPEQTKKMREAAFDLASGGAGMCAGIVIKAGLSMIVPPVAKPATMVGFQVGKWVLSTIGGMLVTKTVKTEIAETYEDASKVALALKEARTDIPELEESSDDSTVGEQTYEIDE